MNRLSIVIKKVIHPFRFRIIRSALGRDRSKNLRVLDVGCGANSCEITRSCLDVSEYHGIDKQFWNGDEAAYGAIDRLFMIDLESQNLDAVSDDYYDVIILSHVIEHIENGQEVISRLCKKLNKGGVIYIETPSERTLNFPSGIGFLNFYDDQSHKAIYFNSDVVRTLQRSGIKVLRASLRRDWWRICLLAPSAIFLNLIYFLPFKRRIFAVGLWDFLGVARFWVGVRDSGCDGI